MKLIVTGAGGMVGQEVVEAFADHDVVALDRAALDVGNRADVLAAVADARPDAIVHCAAMTAVDACESDHDRAYLVNALAVRFVMEAARRAASITNRVPNALTANARSGSDSHASTAVYAAQCTTASGFAAAKAASTAAREATSSAA